MSYRDSMSDEQRRELDELAEEGYRLLSKETCAFAEMALPVILKTWPEWDEDEDAANEDESDLSTTVRTWIVTLLSRNTRVLRIALRQRAKFEGWLKFELAAFAETHGATKVFVEAQPEYSDPRRCRSDVTFELAGRRCDVELKTPNTNWRMDGVDSTTRPITNNIDGIVRDARKLAGCQGTGVVAFVLFPVSRNDDWVRYLDRIAQELGVSLTKQNNTTRLSVSLENGNTADLIVCAFEIPSTGACES